MLTLRHLKKATAIVTMAVASLCGGGKAVAEQKGTLSVVEVRGNAALRPDTRKRLTGFLRSLLIAKGHDDAVVVRGDAETLAAWTAVPLGDDLKGLVSDKSGIGFHAVDETAQLADLEAGSVAEGYQIVPSRSDRGDALLAVAMQPLLSGADIAEASVGEGYRLNDPVVSFRFTPKGQQVFADWTTEFVEKRFAIVVDGEVVTAPVVREPILGGSGQITGNFSRGEAEALALRLSAPPGIEEIVVLRTCPASRPRAPPSWAPKWLFAAPACDE